MVAAHRIPALFAAEWKMGANRDLYPLIRIPGGSHRLTRFNIARQHPDHPATPALHRMKSPAHSSHHPAAAAGEQVPGHMDARPLPGLGLPGDTPRDVLVGGLSSGWMAFDGEWKLAKYASGETLLRQQDLLLLSKCTDRAWLTSMLVISHIANKILENWIYWFVIDAISIYLFISRELYFTAFLFFAYLIIIVIGYRSWHQIRLNQNA